jgi:hypothetical protein
LGAVEYVNLMSRRFALPLPSTLVFDAPTTAAISDFITAKLARRAATSSGGSTGAAAGTTLGRRRRGGAAAAAPLAKLPAGAAAPAAAPLVCIVGSVLRPLEAPEGPAGAAAASPLGPLPVGDTIVPIPPGRWPEAAGEAAGAARFGAFMKGTDLFDASAFGLSTAEATAADPQHRILLEAAGQLLASFSTEGADGSLSARAEAPPLVGSSRVGARGVGVFVGVSWTEYHRLGQAHGQLPGSYSAQGAVLSVACGR